MKTIFHFQNSSQRSTRVPPNKNGHLTTSCVRNAPRAVCCVVQTPNILVWSKHSFSSPFYQCCLLLGCSFLLERSANHLSFRVQLQYILPPVHECISWVLRASFSSTSNSTMISLYEVHNTLYTNMHTYLVWLALGWGSKVGYHASGRTTFTGLRASLYCIAIWKATVQLPSTIMRVNMTI